MGVISQAQNLLTKTVLDAEVPTKEELDTWLTFMTNQLGSMIDGMSRSPQDYRLTRKEVVKEPVVKEPLELHEKED